MNKIYLIPNTLGNENINFVIPKQVQEIIRNLRYFFVENLRTARRYLRKIDNTFPIDNSTFFNIGKRTKKQEIIYYFKNLNNNAGIISESGMPAVADPGAQTITIARNNNFKIVPLVGPSSILLALSASGLNGQNFTFHGYLPIEKNKLIKKLKSIEFNSKQHNQTQIFIETPFRNTKLLQTIIQKCDKKTLLCIAKEITTKNEKIITLPIQKWKNFNIDIHKKNTIFLILSKK